MSYKVESSEDVVTRHMKLLFWGATGTRKTETVLRNFPDVLVIDAEGNTDQCLGMEEIPTFQRVKAKDPRVIIEVLNDVAAGKIKNQGRPIQTVCIDSVSVIWSLASEVASRLAEARAKKYNKAPEEATSTGLDWVVAKRPLKAVQNMLGNLPIKYIIFIARESDLYAEGADMKKIGFKPDMIKGLDFDMNLVLRFVNDPGSKWHAEVVKVQGKLGKLFPIGKSIPVFPTPEFFEYCKNLKPEGGNDPSESDLSESIVGEEVNVKTLASLQAYALTRGIEGPALASLLKTNGFTGYKAENHEAMRKVVDANANGHK